MLGEEVYNRSDAVLGGFAQVPHAVVFDSRLSDGAVRLYCILLRYSRSDDRCWPGVERLSRELSVSRSTISRRFSELVVAGYVARVRRASGSTVTVLLPVGVARSNSDTARSEFETSMDGANLLHEEQTEEHVTDNSYSNSFCSIHGVPMIRREKQNRVWYSHQLENGQWCHGQGTSEERRRTRNTDWRNYEEGK